MSTAKKRFTLKVVDQTMFFHINGALDADIMKDIFIDVSCILQTQLTSEWASVMDLSEWNLYTPEVEADLIKFQHWACKHGQRAEVCITSGSVVKVAARKKILENQSFNVEHIYVNDSDEAKKWLIDHGFLKDE